MKKLLLSLLFIPSAAFAHPLDVSISVFDINSNTETINGATFIHAYEANYLLSEQGKDTASIQSIYDNKDLFLSYVRDSVVLKNNNEPCEWIAAALGQQDEFELMSSGLEVQYEIQCAAPLNIISFSNTLFAGDFQRQTNKNLFYRDRDENLFQKTTTSKLYSGKFDYHNPERRFSKDPDDDNDGLTNIEETYYGTDPQNPDTDFDEYTDGQEIEYGFPPLDPKPFMGQKQFIDPAIAQSKMTSQPRFSITQPAIDVIPVGQYRHEALDLPEKVLIDIDSSSLFNTQQLSKALNAIKQLWSEDSISSTILIFGIIFFLGVLHATESGHGKSILATLLVQREKGYFEALTFNTWFTITHIVDVLLVGIAFKYLSVTGDINQYISHIQKGGGVILIIMGLYLFEQNFSQHKKQHKILRKDSHILGIIAGLAPCTFGWAIAVTTIAIGKTSWIIPLIAVFGLGIFTTLNVFSFIILKVRHRITNAGFIRLAPYISALLIIIIGIVLLLS